MTLFIQNNATGAGAGTLNAGQGAVDLGIIANGDTGLGLAPAVGNRQQVTYARTLAGAPPLRLDTLVNTAFAPNYTGAPQAVPIVILPVGANFTLNNGALITTFAGTALPPSNSGLGGAGLNTTTDCLVIYDTSDSGGAGYCVARNGSGGVQDLGMPTSVLLFHELSHAFRIVNNTLLALTATCDPSSPEENAAIVEENELRTQIANAAGTTVTLRDPGIHCGSSGPCGGGCCIIASVASGSPISGEVQTLRALRDGLLRRTEAGFAFFERFFYDYYDFSPQVCTLMARRPELSRMVLEGFVRPLIIALRLLHHHAADRPGEALLGQRLMDYHPQRAEAAETLAALRLAQAFWQGDFTSEEAVGRELAALLRERAWPSDHIHWALVEPVRIYGEALGSYVDGGDARSLGRSLKRGFTAWAAELPLDHVWASLSARQLRSELSVYESMLLRPPTAKARFRRRLMDRFGDVTAVATVLGGRRALAGDAS